KQTVKLAHEDNFAKLPELTMAWPTVEDLHPDSYALEVLAEYLSQTKRAPFYKVLVEDSKVAPNVQIYNQSAEIAGQFMLRVRAFEGKPLDEVAADVDKAFAKFEKEGIPERDLNRIKAGLETRFYNSLSSVLGKSALLAEYNYLNGNPGTIAQ
ncbi:insulinase family protein, partial [Halobellus sp. Atlit-31R]